MRRKYFVSIGLLLIVVLSLAIGNLLASNKAKEVICNQLEKRLQREVSIRLLWFSLPLQVKMRDLVIFKKGNSKDVFIKVDSLAIGVKPLSLLGRKKIGIDVRLDSPQVFAERTGWKEVNFADIFQSKKDIEPKQTDKSGRPRTAEISNLAIRDGKILLLDKEVDKNGFQARIEGVDVTVSSASVGSESAKRFDVSADFCDIQNLKRGKLKAGGWIDVKLKDMEGELSIQELDLYYFQPYLRPIFPAIKSGKLGFATEVNSKDNDLSAHCKLRVENLKFLASAKDSAQSLNSTAEAPIADTPAEEGIADAVLKSLYAQAIESLKTPDDILEVDFEVKGKMDAPGKVFVNVCNNIMAKTFRSSVKARIGEKVVVVGKGVVEAGKKGAEAVVGKTGKVGQIAEEAGEQIKQAGKELKETLEGVLKQD